MSKIPDWVRLANCAGCGRLVTSTSFMLAEQIMSVKVYAALTSEVAILRGRIKGRPYCSGCLDVNGAGVSGLAGGMATDHGSPSPWLENATRILEDG